MILLRIPRIAHDNKSVRINGEINSPQVRLVGVEGDQLGIVSSTDALRMAEEAEVDLVEGRKRATAEEFKVRISRVEKRQHVLVDG